MASEKKLGRGLASLLSSSVEEDLLTGEHVLELNPRELRPNPFQPRREIEHERLQELVNSIREHGVLQPVVVRKKGNDYELVAGERRWRAAIEAGLASIPVVVRNLSDSDMLAVALVENLQREDLNPMEKAYAFRDLIERFDLTQEQAAKRLGFDRSTIANFIRLLDLPESVQQHVSRGTISMGHARALLALKNPKQIESLCERVVKKGLSVRETERLVSSGARKARSTKTAKGEEKDPYTRDLEDKIRLRLGVKVSLERRGEEGRLVIEYHSNDDLERILEILGIAIP